MMNEGQLEQQDGPKVYKVPEQNLTLLQARIDKLNKKATKLGCETITLTVIATTEVPVYEKDFEGFDVRNSVTGEKIISHYRRVHDLTVSGPAPKLNGWEFIAVIQPVTDEEGKTLGNILRNVPGCVHPVPEQYRKAENNCDHCRTQRRRNETYILRSDAGDSKQVGRNCLRDFLGHASPEFYAEMAQMLLDAADFASDAEHDDFDSRAQRIERFQAEEVLALAACSIRLEGWRSNATAREYGTISTSSTVSSWVFANSTDRKKWEHPLLPGDEDRSTAKEVAEWLKALSERTDLNDYLYNLSILGQGATFTTKNFGLACSAIPTYLREKEREINRRKKFESDKNSQYIGTIGERQVFENLTLVYANEFEGQFGVTHFYKFKDAQGNVVVYFASRVISIPVSEDNMLEAIRNGKWADHKDVETGDTVTLLATVKNQEEYEGVKQTVITRAAENVTKEQKKARKAAKKEFDAAQQEPQASVATAGVQF